MKNQLNQIRKSVKITAILLITLGTQSAERVLALEVYEDASNKEVEAKASKKYTSIVKMGGKVILKNKVCK